MDGKPSGLDPKTLIGQTVKRSITIADKAKPVFDKEKRTVELAIFSEEPQLHMLGRSLVYVKLSMKDGAINLERFNGGLAFTENHDPKVRLGRARDPRTDKTLFRATARFSSRPYASEIFDEVIEDIENGDTPNTSGIARIDDIAPQPIDRIDGIPVVLATKWTPMEACIATIGQDEKVGVGRSMPTDDGDDGDDDSECEDENCEDPDCSIHGTASITRSATMTDPKKPTALETMIERQTTYETFAERFGATDEQKAKLKSIARSFALAGKAEPELFTEIQRVTDEFAKAAELPLASSLTFSEKEQKEYSITRAIVVAAGMKPGGEDLGVKDTNCLEFEVSRTLEKMYPRADKAPIGDFRMPLHTPLRGLGRQVIARAGMDTQTGTKGQELVFAEYQTFIELLRNRARVAQMGAQVISGLRGNPTFPRQTGAGAGFWVGENPGSDVSDADLALDQIQGTPKTFQSSSSYSRQLLAQGVENIDNIVQNDLVMVNALEVDRVAIHGSGSSHQPRGIYNVSGVNSVTFISGGNSAPITYSGAVDMETAINAANADVGAMGYLTTPEVKGTAKKTAQLANTIALPIWQGDEMNGYRALSTNQISKTLGAGSDHGMVFGVWALLMILEWGGALEIIVDPYRLKKQGMIEVTTFLMGDVLCRHPQAFSIAVRLSKS